MELSNFLVHLIFLGLPGVIGSKLYRKLRAHPQRKDWEDVLEIVLFALGSYGILAGLLKLAHNNNFLMTMGPPLQGLFRETLEISWREVGCASLVGGVLPFIAAYIDKYKVINKLGRGIWASNRFGDEDVWDFFHNMDKPEWVYVRDHREKLVYFGWIQAYSESEKARELIIRDAKVFSNVGPPTPGSQLYEAEVVYLSREPDQLSIEIPLIPAPAPPAKNTVPITTKA